MKSELVEPPVAQSRNSPVSYDQLWMSRLSKDPELKRWTIISGRRIIRVLETSLA